MGYFQENLTILKEYQPEIYSYFVNTFNSTCAKDIVSNGVAKDGNGILQIEHNGEVIAMNSTYRPFQEAERYAKQFDEVVDYSLIIVFGFGNGYYPREILKKGEENVKYAFYEPSIDSFVFSLHNYDLSDVLSNNKLTLFVDGINENTFKLWISGSLTYLNWAIYFFFNLPKYDLVFEDKYKEVNDIYKHWKNYVDDDASVSKKNAYLFTLNPIMNLAHIFNSNSLYDFDEKLPKDVPAVIVAAGPSLDKNIEELKKAKNKAFIICVDTAVKRMMAHNIMPDIIVTIDIKKSLVHFTDERVKQIPLAVHAEGNYRVIDTLSNNHIIFLCAINPYFDQVFRLGNSEMVNLPTGGTVAHTAFTMARYLGFTNIILIGQDLALTGNKLHAGDENEISEEQKKSLIKIKDIDDKDIYTRGDFFNYLKWFEMAIETFSELNVIDATEGGAKITGSTIMTLQEAIDKYCKNEYEFTSIINKVEPTFDDEQKAQVYEHIINSRENLFTLKEFLAEAINYAKEGIEELTNTNKNMQILINANRELARICNIIESYDETYFLETLVSELEINTVSDLYIGENNQEEETIRLLDKTKILYQAMYDGVDTVVEMFDNVIKIIDEKIFS